MDPFASITLYEEIGSIDFAVTLNTEVYSFFVSNSEDDDDSEDADDDDDTWVNKN